MAAKQHKEDATEAVGYGLVEAFHNALSCGTSNCGCLRICKPNFPDSLRNHSHI